MRLKEEQLRREEEKVCCVPKATHFHTLTLHVPLATRDRASGAARDQREEAGAVSERGITSVCSRSYHTPGLCLHYRVTTATSKADWPPKGRSPSSPSEPSRHLDAWAKTGQSASIPFLSGLPDVSSSIYMFHSGPSIRIICCVSIFASGLPASLPRRSF